MPDTFKPVCILDDDFSVLNSIKELLASDGLAAQTFENPDKFLAYSREQGANVAVVDIWMPESSGLEVQERLLTLSPRTGVILMTGSETPGIRTVAFEGGATLFWLSRLRTKCFSIRCAQRWQKDEVQSAMPLLPIC